MTLVPAERPPVSQKDLLAPLLPRTRSSHDWERDPGLDAAFGSPGDAAFLLNLAARLVYFTSNADHG